MAQFRNCTYLQVYTFKAPKSVSTKGIAVIMRFPRLKKKIIRKEVTVLERPAQQKDWSERKGGAPEPSGSRVKGYVTVEKECAEHSGLPGLGEEEGAGTSLKTDTWVSQCWQHGVSKEGGRNSSLPWNSPESSLVRGGRRRHTCEWAGVGRPEVCQEEMLLSLGFIPLYLNLKYIKNFMAIL